MNHHCVRISHIAAAVPAERMDNSDWSDDVAETVGVRERRTSLHLSSMDLCLAAARKIGDLDGVDTLLFLSQTAPSAIPATSCLIHRELGLDTGVMAIDLVQGCSGYTYGLSIASSLLWGGRRKVLLLCGDTMQRLCKPADRATQPIFGDAGSATIVEAGGSSYSDRIAYTVGTDGSGAGNLTLAGDRLAMNGPRVFSFACSACQAAMEWSRESGFDVDAVIPHQASGPVIAVMSAMTDRPVISNVDRFGNTASASIPLAIVTERPPVDKSLLVGFGVGWSWASAYVRTSECTVHDLVEVE